MEIIGNDLVTKGGHRSARYPWDEWLDGQHRAVKRGVDFPETTEPVNFGEAIRLAARRRNLRVKISVTKDHPGEVHFQVVGPYEPTVDRAAHQ